MAETKDKLITAESLKYVHDSLSEKIVDYIPKNQGTTNVGKILVVGTDGNIVLTNMPEGASSDVIGVFDDSNNLLLSGDIDTGTYTLKFENTDGTYTGSGTLVVSGIVSYTNLANPTSEHWQNGYRLSVSGGGTAALAGHTTTNYIPCKVGDVLRVKGFKIIGNLSDNGIGAQNDAKIIAYDSSKTKLVGAYGYNTEIRSDYNYYYNKVSVDGDVSTYTIMVDNDGEQLATDAVAYIRIDGQLLDGYTNDNVIITINEEISY